MPPQQHKVLLTGGSGALGRNFLDLVAKDPAFEVLSLLRHSSQMSPTNPNDNIRRINFDDQDTIDGIIDEFRPTCLVHAAATGMNLPKPTWPDLVHFNVDVSLKLCQSLANHPACRIVYISTGLAYKNQDRPLHETDALDTLHPYGASKAAADLLMRAAAVEYGLPITVLRPFSFTGRWDVGTRLFPSLLQAANQGKVFQLSAGEQHRDHCSALDVAAGIRAAILDPNQDKQPRIYNLGSGSTQKLRSLIEGIVEAVGLKVDLHFGARPYALNEPMFLVADNRAAQRDLGWKPQHNLAHAVWMLAQESFPQLKLQKPREDILV